MKPLNVGLKIIVDKKINNLKELEIWTDLNFLSSIIKSRIDKRKTKNLEKMSESIVRVITTFKNTPTTYDYIKKLLENTGLLKTEQ